MPKVMCCQSSSKLHKIKYPAIAQEKCDGIRVIIEYFGTMPRLFTRRGNELTQLPFLDQAIVDYLNPGYMYDGELLFGKLDRKTGNGLARKAQEDGNITEEESKLAHVRLWDIIPHNDYNGGFCPTRYSTRFDLLKTILSFSDTDRSKIDIVESTLVSSALGANHVFADALLKGKEGIVLKNTEGAWEANNHWENEHRSYDQIKMKPRETIDLRIVDMVEGNGKNEYMCGAIHCMSDDLKIDVWVGSGINDITRIDMWENPDAYIGKVVEIKYNTKIDSKQKPGVLSLFLPSFGKMRYDKITTSTISELK